MYGLKAISAGNGWLITVAGAGIVFSGLLMLAGILSCMERLLRFYDRQMEALSQMRRKWRRKPRPRERVAEPPIAQSEPATAAVVRLTEEERQTAYYFQWITKRLGEPFSLPLLLEHAEKRGIARPHSRLDHLLRVGLIVEAEGDARGFYVWRSDLNIFCVDERGQ